MSVSVRPNLGGAGRDVWTARIVFDMLLRAVSAPRGRWVPYPSQLLNLLRSTLRGPRQIKERGGLL